MSIVLIGGEKGGTGKTTLATNIAANRTRAGRDVILVDTDPQGSAAYWKALRDDTDAPPVACVQLHGKGMQNQVRDLAKRYEEIVIEAGGRDSVELRASMLVADRMVTPIQASQYDTWTLDAMARLVEQARGFNPELDAAVCINRASTNPRVGEADEARELIAEFPELRLLATIIRDRIAFRRTARDGLSVEEGGGDNKAASEIVNLTAEVYPA